MSSVVIAGNTSGTVTLNAPDIAGTTIVNLPANSMNMGNGGGGVSTNTALGSSALNANTTGINNTGIGFQALGLVTTGSANTGVGLNALYNNTASFNTAVGSSALQNNTTGTPNDAFGYQALFSNTTGNNNVSIGYASLYSNSTGNTNTAVGVATLYANTVSNNTAVGWNALRFNTTGTPNDAFGYQALYNNTTGVSNVAVGSYAGAYCLSGSRNAYIGVEAGPNTNPNSTGNDNTTVGYRAGAGISTGSSNVFIGGNAGYNGTTNLTTGVANVVIGQNSGTNGVGAQYQIVIGSGFNGQGDNYVSLGKGANYVYNQFTVNATWTRTSDERIKKDIQDDPLGLDFITKLRPVTYKWKPSNEVPAELHDHHTEENVMDLDAVMNGFIAQEVKSALDAVGNPVFGGWVTESDGAQAVSREMFIMPLVNAVKELAAKVEALEAQLAAK
jgi:hypothetical protein